MYLREAAKKSYFLNAIIRNKITFVIRFFLFCCNIFQKIRGRTKIAASLIRKEIVVQS